MIQIKCSADQQEKLQEFLKRFDEPVSYEVIEYGSITDEEIDKFGKFDDYQKKIIKEMYAKYPKGFFPNPMCALY